MGSPDEITAAPERAVRWFDRWQGRHGWSAFPIGVVRKYADDRGSAMAGLFTHYAFLALFPLLILLLTGLDLALDRWPSLRREIVDTVVGQLPVIGETLRDESSSLAATGIGLAVGVLGLLWGATGLYNSAQLAMSQVWNVEGVDRMGLVSRLVRAVALFALLFLGAAVAAVASLYGVYIGDAPAVRLLGMVGGTAINVVVVLGALRIVTPPVVAWRRLLLPALLSGVAWEVLQMVGQWLVTRQLSRTQDLYGVFAYVIGTLAWLNLMARVIVFSVEVSVVAADGLYPRRIAQPPLTGADRDVLDRIVHNERRRPEQRIDIRWDASSGAAGGPTDDGDADGSAEQGGEVVPGHDRQQHQHR